VPQLHQPRSLAQLQHWQEQLAQCRQGFASYSSGALDEVVSVHNRYA
jgi:hypothetical protein